MDNQVKGLESLAEKYANEINDLQRKLEAAKNRYMVVSEALELLKKDGEADQVELFPSLVSEKYKGMSMTDAIKDIIESHPNNKVSADEVFSALKKHGFQSKSKNLKRDVFTRLYRQRKNGKLICRTEKGIKKYFLPETNSEAE